VDAVNDSLKAEGRIPCPINKICRRSASVSKKELQGVEDEGNENKSGETMGLANRNGNEEAPRDQDC